MSIPAFWGGTFHGILPEWVTAEIWRLGLYDRPTTQLLVDHLRPGGTFVDIGAHFGYFTLLASQLVGPKGKVVAIEPIPATFDRLRHNVEANGLANVELVKRAALDQAGDPTFRDFGTIHSALNTCCAARGVLAGKDASGTPVRVKAERGDALLAGLDCADIVKIDAESSEEQVLAGLSGFLAAQRAGMVLIELGGGDRAEDTRARAIAKTMWDFGYKTLVCTEAGLEPVIFRRAVPFGNYAFLPR